MAIGRVKFYLVDKGFGFITAEDGTEMFFHRNDLSGITKAFDIKEDMPVVFDVGEKYGRRCAVHVRRSNEFAEEAYFINRFQGRVTSWRQAGGCGFIGYLDVGQKKSIFFHISGVNAAEDGVQYEPREGCLVDFERGIRQDKEIAKDVVVLEWPEVEQPLDEIFLNAEELPVSFPESKLNIEPQSELLKPESRKKTLLELIEKRTK
jgi:cold shock CspA family protein